jgi:hypothetical protein
MSVFNLRKANDYIKNVGSKKYHPKSHTQNPILLLYESIYTFETSSVVAS